MVTKFLFNFWHVNTIEPMLVIYDLFYTSEAWSLTTIEFGMRKKKICNREQIET